MFYYILFICIYIRLYEYGTPLIIRCLNLDLQYNCYCLFYCLIITLYISVIQSYLLRIISNIILCNNFYLIIITFYKIIS